MSAYTALTASGRRVYAHDAQARTEYNEDVACGEAEMLRTPWVKITLRSRDHRLAHEYASKHDLCYGPCSIKEASA